MTKIAVIGAGISGLSAAYLLSKSADVTVYEHNAYIGGHTRTKTIDYNGKLIAVDTGFIVMNHVNYPELTGFFQHLNVALDKSDMSFAMSIDQGRFEWCGDNLNTVFGQRRNALNPKFYVMLRDIARFFKHTDAALTLPDEVTLGEYLAQLRMSEIFTRQFILPMGAAIWSCSAHQMLAFPARTFVQFFKNHGLLSFNGHHQWHTVRGGAARYVEKIVAALPNAVRVATPVAQVQNVDTMWHVTTRSGEVAHYDHVIFASHADETLAMLADATQQERAVLGAFEFQKNAVILHKDTTQMPRRTRCWASWNYLSAQNADRNTVAVTYWMNRLQNIDRALPLFVTLNPITPIDPTTIFDQHEFMHPIFTANAIAAQKLLPTIQGLRGAWFCGAYWRNGFHEDGIFSGVNVAKALGAHVPWH